MADVDNDRVAMDVDESLLPDLPTRRYLINSQIEEQKKILWRIWAEGRTNMYAENWAAVIEANANIPIHTRKLKAYQQLLEETPEE